MSSRALVYESELGKQLADGLRRAKDFRFALALVSVGGFELLLENLRACLGRGGRGRLLFGTDLPTHPEAIARLMHLSIEFPKAFEVRRFRSPKKRFFHPKLYLFASQPGSQSAVVGSANLTGGGLQRNYEASVWTNDKSAVADLFEYFDELFGGGNSHAVTTEWLQAYRRLWAERQKTDEDAERTRGKVRAIKERDSRQLPRRIKGHSFVFTGRIDEWPRERRLYPEVRRLGGKIGQTASSVAKADCLVHGDALQKGDSTRKLREAHSRGVTIISEEDFMRVLESEKRIRRAKS